MFTLICPARQTFQAPQAREGKNARRKNLTPCRKAGERKAGSKLEMGAGRNRPGVRAPFVDECVSDGLRHFVESLSHPAYITGLRWDILAWNAAAEKLFTLDAPLPEENRNVLIYMFLERQSRHVFAEAWMDEAKRIAAMFRMTFDLWSHEPAFIGLVKRLRAASLEFTSVWDTHEVQGGGAVRKVLRAADNQPQSFDYATFQANANPSVRLATYIPLHWIGSY